MTFPTTSYADVFNSQYPRDDHTHSPGLLGYSVNRQNTTSPVSVTARRPSAYSSLTDRRPSALSLQQFHRVTSIASQTASSSGVSEVSPTSYHSDALREPREPREPKRPKRRHRHRRKFSTGEANQKKSPLIIAILAKDLPRVESLIEKGANVRGEDDSYDKPLQTAALVGSEEILKYLLSYEGLEINSRDRRSRTAMFAAKSRGYDNIAKLLSDRGAKPLSSEEERIAQQELKIWRRCDSLVGPPDQVRTEEIQPFQAEAPITNEPEEHIPEEEAPSSQQNGQYISSDGNTTSMLEAGSIARIKEKQSEADILRQNRQKNGEWIKGPPKLPEQQTPQEEILPQEPRYPGFHFKAPVVEFDFTDEGGHRIILPPPTVDELIYGRGPENIRNEEDSPFQGTCRWYHLPANHLGWVKDLITKIYEKRSKEEKMKKEILFSQEPFSTGEMEHTDPTSLDPIPQSRALRPKFRSLTLERLGPKRLSTAMELRIPFVNWETRKNQREMNKAMKDIRQEREYDIKCREYGHAMTPNLKAIGMNPGWSKDEKLLRAYLYNNLPLHPRRTLDQFYYHMLEDTQARDEDQVIDRYYQNRRHRNKSRNARNEHCHCSEAPDTSKGLLSLNNPDGKKELELSNGHQKSLHLPDNSESVGKSQSVRALEGTDITKQSDESRSGDCETFVMMVDQLWIWILDENTIITSFPQTWNDEDDNDDDEDRGHDLDETDVLKSIYSHLSLQSRKPLESVYDLAQLIVTKCLANFCTQSTPYYTYGPMRILDVYESAIAAVTDSETKLFNDFATKSKKGKDVTELEADDYQPEDLYSIDAEIEQLREVKDIQDELHIISVLLDSQKLVFEKANSTMKKRDSRESWSRPATARRHEISEVYMEPASDSLPSHQFEKLGILIDEQDKRRKAIEWQAEQANRALNHLLDLKQKQANVSEARSARLTSKSTAQQGSIMVLFTLVTIIFAPLSLMATMFGVDIEEYPDKLHMEYVLRYMFAVSVAVTVPLIGLVIYTTRLTIRKLWIKAKRWWKISWDLFSAILRTIWVRKLSDKGEREAVVDVEKAQA